MQKARDSYSGVVPGFLQKKLAKYKIEFTKLNKEKLLKKCFVNCDKSRNS